MAPRPGQPVRRSPAADLLTQGFQFQNHRVPLLGPQGIWKPQVLPQYPLSITTTPKGPYNDSFGSDELLRYAYRGTDPEHRDNVGLRAALTHQVPLVYFHGLMPGKYVAAWPVYVVGDELRCLRFKVAPPATWGRDLANRLQDTL